MRNSTGSRARQGRVRILAQVAAVAALVLLAAGCASPSASTAPASASAPEPPAATGPVGADDLRFTCGRFPFSVEILTAPGRQDEDAANPAAEALRRHLVQGGPDIDFLPDDGWTLVGMDGQLAEFVIVVGGDPGMKSVSVENSGGQWNVSGWGGCRPTVVLAAGLGEAEWAWGGPGQPGPDTRTFDALVTERSCASGKSSEGRVVGPEIVRTDEMVLVMFAVRPLPGDFFDCQGNPSTRVPVDLGEPLGDRQLLDGGRLPFADPTEPRF